MALASRRSQVSAKTLWTIGANVGLMAALVLVLARTRTVTSWVLIAILLALALNPVVRWLEARRIRLGPAVGLVMLSTVLFLVLLGVSFVPMLVDQAQSLVKNAPEHFGNLRASRPFAWLDERFDVVSGLQDWLRSRSSSLARSLFGVVLEVFGTVAAMITILLLTVFMLLFGRDVVERSLLWAAPYRRPRYRRLARQIGRKVGGYVSGALLISAIGGLVTAVGMLLLGVPYFLPLGLAMMLLGVIPWIGSALGAVLVVSTTFATAGTRAGLIALGVYLLYQQAENHLLQPLIQRHTIRMNPLIISLAMLFGTALFGILGALVTLPVAGAVQVLMGDALARRQRRLAMGRRPRRATRPLPGGPQRPAHVRH